MANFLPCFIILIVANDLSNDFDNKQSL